MFGRIEQEEEEARQAKQERLKANAPKPGARPDKPKRGAASADLDGDVVDGDVVDSDVVDDDLDTVAEDTSGPSNKPRPGQKPQSTAGSRPKNQGGLQTRNVRRARARVAGSRPPGPGSALPSPKFSPPRVLLRAHRLSMVHQQ